MKLIPDDINIDFMGKRKFAFAVSGTLVGLSLIWIAGIGLNLGIDFKGGSAIIVAFQEANPIDRGELQTAISDLVTEELGEAGSQVSVQDFNTGVASETDGQPTRRFLIYTEVTSLVSQAKREEIAGRIKGKFGDETTVELPSEGSDVFYLGFAERASIPERYGELTALFTELGYEHVGVLSDVEKAMRVEWFEGLALIRDEQRQAAEGAELTAEEEFEMSRDAFDKRLEKQLADKKDRRFTVSIEELKGKVAAKLGESFGPAFVAVESATSVSPSVGRDLLSNGLLAILYAIIGILIYITLRFDFRYGPGAVVALVHDVIITIGIFSVLQVKFSLPIIAALLTIVGYSLNDTIVVMDRVRETFDEFRGRDMKDLLNRAINNTLSRTVLTSFTTLLVVTAILVWGGGLIQDFALALLVGVIVGTYSSVYVASPMVYYMDLYLQRREKAARRRDSGQGPVTAKA